MKGEVEGRTLPEPGSDERQLCLKCLIPNLPEANFCRECGAPLTAYAATGPFESIFAEGDLYRQAIQKPRNLTVLIGVWLLFGGMGVSGVVALFFDRSIPTLLWGALLLVISGVVLWTTTHRYANRVRS